MTTHTPIRPARRLFSSILGLLLLVPALAAGAPRRSENQDLCLAAPTGGGSFNRFIFQDVAPLAAGKVIPLHGMYFNGTQRPIPISGSALMSSDGVTVRLGVFVHSSATSSSTFAANDFTLSATTDATWAGDYHFDNDGDYRPNGTLPVTAVDCSTIVIP